MTARRMSPAARTSDLLAAAVRIAEMKGYQQVTREDIAMACGVSPALVSHSLGTMVQMRRSLMRAAVANEVLVVIAQGLAVRDPHALKAPDDVRRRAADEIGRWAAP